MYTITESTNGTKTASYEIDNQTKAIKFANQLMWEQLDHYGRNDGDLDNVCDAYQTADKNNMSASITIGDHHWIARITRREPEETNHQTIITKNGDKVTIVHQYGKNNVHIDHIGTLSL